jgi:hypothetical protein
MRVLRVGIQASAFVLGFTVLSVAPAAAQDDVAAIPDIRPSVSPISLTAHVRVLASSDWTSSRSKQQELLLEIAAWLSAEFELPVTATVPRISIVSQKRIAGLRFRDLPSDRWGASNDDILAVYDDEARTVYLPEGWTGKSPAEFSVLVHEMVHHIQNEAGQKFDCPAEREKMAFDAQERWLAMFGRDLETEFEIDPLTRLVRTNCLMMQPAN